MGTYRLSEYVVASRASPRVGFWGYLSCEAQLVKQV